jgi:hypothetical protein
MLQTIKAVLRMAGRLFVIHSMPEKETDNESLHYTKPFFLTDSYSEDDPLEF